MKWSDIPFDPPPRVLRQFAGLWLAFIGSLAGWQYLAGRPVAAAVSAALAVGVGVLGLVAPRAVRPVFVTAMVVTFPIGFVVSNVLLALVYYGLFTPVGLVFRLLGRDALRLRPQPNVSTYWVEKPQMTDPRRYLQQF